MTAKRRSSGSMTCPARAGCSGSRSEGTTGFRSGPRTVHASRFSPIATATSPSSGSPPTAAAPPNASRSPNRANHMCRSPGLRRPTGSCSASRRGPTCRCGRSRCRIGRRRRSATSTRSIPPARVFSPDGRWVAYTSTERGQDDDLRPAIPGHREPSISSSRSGPTLRMQPLWSPDGKELFYNPGPGRFEASASRRSRRLPSGIPWRCRDRFKRRLPTREGLRHHTRWQVRGLIPAGQTESGTPWLRRSRWSSTGSKS